jgi:hypothetical protein
MGTGARQAGPIFLAKGNVTTMTPQLASILADLDIEPVDTRVRRAPGQTCATATMDRLLADHGAGHVILTLRTIMESENNRMELVAPTILAVSDMILAHPTWPETGLAWLEAFDGIDLGALRGMAKANRKAAQPRAAIGTMLFIHLSQTFGVQHQGRLL